LVTVETVALSIVRQVALQKMNPFLRETLPVQHTATYIIAATAWHARPARVA
jgi:hypothetical protein